MQNDERNGSHGIQPAPGKAARQTDLSEEQKSDIKDVFDLFDLEGTGFIEAPILKYAIRSLGLQMTKQELNGAIVEIDKTGEGEISFSDFLQLIAMKMPENYETDDELGLFPFFEDNATQQSDVEILRKASLELCETSTDNLLQDLIKEADDLSETEFLRFLKRKAIKDKQRKLYF